MSEENPLLDEIQMPGQRFRLPSRGLFYTDGELDDSVVDGEVEVFSMTAVDEISLRSPEFLFDGTAIERVFKRCIPEVKKPLRLLSKDVDYLLTALRIVSYGNVLDINLRCEKCQEREDAKKPELEQQFIEEVRQKAEEQNVDFELAMKDQKVLEKLKNISEKKVQKRSYQIDLKGVITNQTTEISDEEFKKYSFILENGQRVLSTPLKMDSAVMSYQFQNRDLSRDLDGAEDYIAFVMASCILKIVKRDGQEVSNPEHIAEWSRKLPIKLKEELSKKLNEQAEWGTDFTYKLVCPDCGHERDANTLLNPITFFIQPSDQEEASK